MSEILTYNPIEPNTCNRFIVEFPQEFNIDSWFVRKINKPKLVHGEWDDIKIELFGAAQVSKGLFKIVDAVRPPTKEDGCIFNFKIKTLDAAWNIIEEINVHVKAVLFIDFGELDYDKGGLVKPFLIIKPHDCVLV